MKNYFFNLKNKLKILALYLFFNKITSKNHLKIFIHYNNTSNKKIDES